MLRVTHASSRSVAHVRVNIGEIKDRFRIASRGTLLEGKMLTKWQAGLITCILIFMTSLQSAWATSNDTAGTEGPSMEETLAFIKDTWEACATMHSGLQRMIAKDGSLWHMDRMAKVEVAVMPPSALRIVTRLNERRKLSGIFGIQSPAEMIQEFDLNALSPDVIREREGENVNLYGIRLRCTRGACVNEWLASLAIAGKPMHDLKTGKLDVTSLDELVYEDRAPKDRAGEKKAEVYIPVCDTASLDSLSKAFHHAIIKAGGKKPLF